MTATTLRTPLAAALLALAAGAAGCAPTQRPPAASTADRVARGRVLVGVGGCNDCHTPYRVDPALGIPLPRMDRLLSGHPAGAPDPAAAPAGTDQAVIGPTMTSFRMPFGVVYAANLTPDPETGLGSWTEEMFLRAVRTGRHFGGQGRPILPPMPWMNLAQQSDEDLRAIWAYLRSLPPVKNGVPSVQVPQPVLDRIASAYDSLLASPESGPDLP